MAHSSGFSGLPPRPNFSAQPNTATAGPSRPSRRQQVPTAAYGGAYPQQSHQQYDPSSYYPSPQSYAWQGYQQQPQPYAYPHSYPYPYPGQPAQAQSFGQSLFAFKPTATPEGYSYSSTYQPEPAASSARYPPSSLPNKRARVTPSVGHGGSSQAWRNCSYPGCTFVGSGHDVDIHEGDRHLMFPKGKMIERSEEEERYGRILGPNPVIQGTSIRLQTEEDIAKWIAERKANWPSKKRAAEKAEEAAQAIARGELPGRGRGRGGRGGFLGKRARDPAAQAEDWGREPIEQLPPRDNLRGRGRGRGRGDHFGGGRGRGRGGHHSAQQNHGKQARPAILDAAEPIPTAATAQASDATKTAKANLLAGLDDYSSEELSGMSSGSSLSESSSTSSSDSDSDTESDSSTTSQTEEAQSSIAETAVAQPDKPVCKSFSQNGKCKFGDRCRFAHIPAGDPIARPPAPGSAQRPIRQPPTRKVNPFERPSLLGALLANPIQNTISQLSQTIRFLVANDMLEGVELRPGELDEEEQARNKVIEVPEM